MSRFVPEEVDKARIPVVIISGFLGSGKSTLINRLLKEAEMAMTAVAINEFGEIPIDQLLIEHDRDKTIVMSNGCICCNLSGEMEDAVMRIFSRSRAGNIPAFDRLIIEPSGLSDPAGIAQTIIRNPLLSRSFGFHALVTVVAADLFESQLERFAEVRKQIELADTLVLTKADLVDADKIKRVRRTLTTLNPSASILVASAFSPEASAIFPLSFLKDGASGNLPTMLAASGIGSPANIGHGGHHHREQGDHSRLISASLVSEKAMAWPALERWLRHLRITHGQKLLRIKGIVNLCDVDGPIIIQAVEHVQSVPVKMNAWPDDDRRTRIVVIGKGIDLAVIRASWDNLCNEAGLYGRSRSES